MHGSLMNWLAAPKHGWQLAAFIFGGLGVGAIILGLMMSTPARYRKTVVALATFVAGLFYSLEFLIPPQLWPLKPHRNPLTDARPLVGEVLVVVFSFALLLGVWNLIQIHGHAIVKRSHGWYNSAAFFVSFIVILATGFLKDAHIKGAADVFTVTFNGFLNPMDATMFSLVAFYIVSAAYRAFRVRSVESALMMVTAAIVMLALVPVGVQLTNWLPKTGFLSVFRLENLGYWLLIWPNMAAQRAIAFGIGVGAMAMGLRVWLSLERGSFFDKQL
ncbi:MAG: hypothetical protein ABFD49_06390 [Armatimonadota bacterium]|nr:hypothetical protein [bacterium]